MKKRIISLICTLAILFGCTSILIPFACSASDAGENQVLIEESNIPLKLWYDEEAPKINEHASHPDYDGLEDDGWQQWSLPIGNGYFGASVFGRTETERIQITEKTLGNKRQKIEGSGKDVSYGGLNNFSETFIDFGHTDVSDYERYLDMKTAISGVEYTYGGVKYTREYFTSYPDKALVIRLDADTNGALSFTLRPTVPYEQSYMAVEGDGFGKSGTVTSSVTDGGVGYIELAGKLEYYDVDFLGIYKVYTDGGTVTASTVQNTWEDNDGTSYTDTDGTIVVNGANSAYIVVTLGTDYELTSDIFTSSDTEKPTFNTNLDDTRVKVEADMVAIDAKIAGKTFSDAYNTLKNAHIADHSELFGRVTVDLGCDPADFDVTTDALLESYKSGYKSTYLEVLLFQYGRYQLIASSRDGALPANLQGVWNPYNTAPWGSGYWHNINIQMNYWPAFSTNLAETFKAYVDFNDAFMQKAEANATSNVNKYNSYMLDEDGGNGWVIGVGSFPFSISSDRSAGNLGFTTQLFWEYYQYTKDETILKEIVLPKLLSAARYITKCVELDENGNYLVSYCDSPEVHVDGVWYYTKGTTYAQTFAYLNNYHTLKLAEEAEININEATGLYDGEYAVLNTVMEQLDKYDPINVGLSGQVKEFREEDYYSSVGDDPNHRHVSQLVGLYPGNIINSNTPAWIDAALVTLEGRGQNTTGGWVYSHKTGLYARAKDGDAARERVDELLSRVTFPNLFTKLWDVYQIDASCGVTAGIAEMLLQSNAGYIEPLAALPSNWDNGSYTGLCAEGNFEVSAAWENGIAKTFNILSKSGGIASIAYPGISTATVVKASNGKSVDCTVNENNRISFETEIGETYIISGLTEEKKISAPTALNIKRSNTFGEFTLDWTAVSDAESYNVYMAIENDAAYTLIGNTQSTSFNYTHEEKDENARTTFAVTAVSSGGSESKRILCYSNPIDTTAKIIDSKAYILESGEVQFVINANSASKKFRLYSKSDSESGYSLVSESLTPVIKFAKYDASLDYAVSALSFYDEAESELYPVNDFASYSTDYNSQNVFEGKTFVQNGTSTNAAALSDKYGYATLTDGIKANSDIHTGRYSSKKANSSTTRMADAVIDLGADYFLDEITFFVYGTGFLPQIGTNFKLEVYSGGEWVSVISNLKSAYADDYVTGEPSISDYLIKVDNGNDTYHLVFDLNGIRGSKVRFYSESIFKDGNGAYNYITFWEIECSGVLVENLFENENNILEGKTFTQISTAPSGLSTQSYSGYGYEKMTDGILDRSNATNGRYSSIKGGAAYAVADLGGIYSLGEIRFYYYARNFTHAAGTKYNIEVFYNNEWTTAVNSVPASEILISNNNTTDGYVFFDLNGIKAEKIRFYVEASDSTQYVTFYEVECSGYCISEFVKQDDNLFIGKEFESGLATTTATIGGVYYEFTYANLTDGLNNATGTAANGHIGRFSTLKGGSTSGTLELNEVFSIDEIRFYPFEFTKKDTNIGTNFTLEVYSGGIWIPIVSNLDNATLVSEYKHSSGTYVSFNLNGITAEKVRFYADPIDSTQYITLYEIECFGSKIINRTYENAVENALVNATVTAIDAADPSNAHDSSLETAVSGTADNGTYSVDFAFDDTKLFTLGIYESIDAANLVSGVPSTASNKTKVEIYRDGIWLTVYNNIALDKDGYTELNLYGTTAEKIRITFCNTRKFDGEDTYRCAKIAAITCTPGKPNAPDRTPMIEAYDKLAHLNISTEDHSVKMEVFRTNLTNYLIKAENIETYANEMNAYYETLKEDIVSSIEFVPKTSITLDESLVLNVYIPSKNLVKFTLDGTDYVDLSTISERKVTVNGIEYYRFEITLAAKEAARDILLIATVNSGENDVVGRFSVSTVKYAEKILADGNDIEKQLMRDILSYIRAAYDFFPVDGDTIISKIDSIIGSDYNEQNPYTPTEQDATPTGLDYATFSLDSIPALKLYGSNASSYTYKINNKILSFVTDCDDVGDYVEIDLYAYAMCETVTYYDAEGIEIGSFNIACYLEWAKTDGDDTLVTVVERFAKYCESARDYKNSVTGG